MFSSDGSCEALESRPSDVKMWLVVAGGSSEAEQRGDDVRTRRRKGRTDFIITLPHIFCNVGRPSTLNVISVGDEGGRGGRCLAPARLLLSIASDLQN